MSKNSAVTQLEIDFPETAVLVSRTDDKGVITYANDAFIEICGYTRNELIGADHNIVRHPDMPKWLFDDLWQTIQSGHPWRGCFKNRSKNGDHYWVKANVSPIMSNGKVMGYLSLRKKPNRAEVAVAESLYRSGKPPATRFSIADWFGKLSLQKKLQVLLQSVLLLVVGAATFFVADHVKTRMIDTVQKRADAVANEVMVSSNMLMITGQISQPETRQLLLKKLASADNIVSLQLARSDDVVKQYGAGSPDANVRDEVQRKVIASKKSHYEIVDRGEKTLYRVVTPYLFTHNFQGTDCLTCHTAKEGAVAGVSDIEIDMTADFKDHMMFLTIINVGQVVFQGVLFIFIGWVIKQFVSRRVTEIKGHLADMVNGKMTGDVDVSGRDEMGEILCAVQSTKILLGSMVDQISTVSGTIDARAKLLAATVSNVEQSSQSQSESASRMAAAVEELTISINQVASNAEDVRQISDNSKKLASNGEKVVHQVVGDMEKINAAVMNSAQIIDDLGKKSVQIQDIVKLIKGIAAQTNLLALNATIEAARAGEQGRGFAVVADEVRKLSEQTRDATQEISDMTATIMGSTSAAVAEMDAAVAMVKAGSLLTQQAGAVIIEINGGALRVLNGVQDISDAIHEQSETGREIASNVEKVAQMSEENSASVRKISTTVENIEYLTQSLEESVKHFSV